MVLHQHHPKFGCLSSDLAGEIGYITDIYGKIEKCDTSKLNVEKLFTQWKRCRVKSVHALTATKRSAKIKNYSFMSIKIVISCYFNFDTPF